MFGLKQITIEFLTGQPWLVLLGLIGLLALSFLLYFRTNPPVKPYVKAILVAVRVLAVLALVVAISEPVVSYSREYTRTPRVSFLVDHSASMGQTEHGKTRKERLDSLLNSSDVDLIESSADVTTYYFGAGLGSDVSAIETDRTALGDAIRELEKIETENQSDFWLLFSDGNSNAGQSPSDAAKGLQVPVMSVGLASGEGGFDIALEDLEYDPILFVGQPVDLTAKLKWQGASGKRVQVSLSENNRAIAENRYAIDEEAGFGEVKLRYNPTEPGRKLLRVSVTPLEGEVNDGNNSKSFAVKVLKSRLEVLLVSPKPDYETGFLNRHLIQTDRYNVTMIATGPNSGNLSGQLPGSQSELNRYDLIVWHNPGLNDLNARQQVIKSYLSEKGGALWIMFGDNSVNAPTPQWLREILPFYPDVNASAQWRDLRAVPVEGQLFHPSIRLADDRVSIRALWSELPPFQLFVPCQSTGNEATILATAGGPGFSLGSRPVLGYRRVGPGKVMASAVLPFWTWAFENLAYNDDQTNYNRFVDGTINWLTIQDDLDPIRVNPVREVFSRGEAVQFEGFAFDQGYRPLSEVTGVVRLNQAGTGETFESDLIELDEGSYRADFAQLPPGTYDYEATLEKSGRELKKSTGRILVETFSLEEYDQSGDPATLTAVSRASGGDYFDYSSFDQLVSRLDLDPIVEAEESELPLWGRTWLLLLFVGALGLEWALRKANHLL